MRNNVYSSLEMRLIKNKNFYLYLDKDNCDKFGNISEEDKINLYCELIEANFMNNISGFYLEKVNHNINNIERKKLLWVLDSQPYSLDKIKHLFGTESRIYRKSYAYQINNGISLFILNNELNDVIPIEKELLIITEKGNFNHIIDDMCSTVNQNNAVRYALGKIKKKY